ncbi:hypothetical protein DL98DRAFT_435040, partial [Cadophora sp. DSE1049]
LDLFIKLRRRLTRELLYYTKSRHVINPWVLFSGPYGKSILINDSENIFIIASSFGVAIYLLYLKQLIYSYNTCEVRACRIYLVWQVRDLSKL